MAQGKHRGGNLGGARNAKVKVKSARGRKLSSKLWLERQLNDPYVVEAQRRGFRSRSAFKILELDERFHFLKRGQTIVDLGAAPGGWSQIVADRVGVGQRKGGRVVAIDILEMEPLSDVEVLCGDFTDPDMPAILKAASGGPVDVVMSDMAAPATGHQKTDHLRIIGLCEAALDFAEDVLAVDGCFIAKVFQGGSERDLLTRLKDRFRSVRHAKPPASRSESAETYVVAMGFRPLVMLDGEISGENTE
jgi:23S rRNA (uridine2552-2'-O)-methyltransferase